jgi:hypothetical protein
VDFTILLGATVADTVIRFAVAPAEDAIGFAVLRGFARPYTGPAPVTSLRIPVINVAGPTYFIDEASEFSLLRCTSATDTTLTLNPIGVSNAMNTGSYVSIVQRGVGQAIVAEDTGVTINCPAGFLPRTRALGSTITLTCEYGDGDEWSISGDLAEE